VHLLHTGFVDTPILATGFTDHRLILQRQHCGDMHAGWVVPDEKRLTGLLGIIAIKKIDDLAGNLLIYRLRPFQGQRTFVAASLVLFSAVRRLAPKDISRRRQTDRSLRIDRSGHLGDAGDWRVFAWRRNSLISSSFVDVGEAHLL